MYESVEIYPYINAHFCSTVLKVMLFIKFSCSCMQIEDCSHR